MEVSQLQKIKALLPVEVTAAFIAIQAIVNGPEDPSTGLHPGANQHFLEMLGLLVLLSACNVALIYKGGERRLGFIAFSTLGFLIWAINLDSLRWEDPISLAFEAGPGDFFTNLFFPVLVVIYSLTTAILTTRSENTSNIDEVQK